MEKNSCGGVEISVHDREDEYTLWVWRFPPNLSLFPCRVDISPQRTVKLLTELTLSPKFKLVKTYAPTRNSYYLRDYLTASIPVLDNYIDQETPPVQQRDPDNTYMTITWKLKDEPFDIPNVVVVKLVCTEHNHLPGGIPERAWVTIVNTNDEINT
jgi:hypothetical protein